MSTPGVPATSLEEKKAAIDQLVDRFAWHLSLAQQTGEEVGRKLGEVGDLYGAEALPVLQDAIKRFREVALRFQSVASPHVM